MDTTLALRALLAARQALLDARATWWLQGGTLLGIIRDGGLMAHDKDIDLALPFAAYDPAIHTILARHGIEHRRQNLLRAGRLARSDNYSYQGLQVDLIYWIDSSPNTMSAFSFRRTPIEYIQPRHGIATHPWHGLAWPIPADPRRWLATAYGPTWHQPHRGRWTAASSPSGHRRPDLIRKVSHHGPCQ